MKLIAAPLLIELAKAPVQHCLVLIGTDFQRLNILRQSAHVCLMAQHTFRKQFLFAGDLFDASIDGEKMAQGFALLSFIFRDTRTRHLNLVQDLGRRLRPRAGKKRK